MSSNSTGRALGDGNGRAMDARILRRVVCMWSHPDTRATVYIHSSNSPLVVQVVGETAHSAIVLSKTGVTIRMGASTRTTIRTVEIITTKRFMWPTTGGILITTLDDTTIENALLNILHLCSFRESTLTCTSLIFSLVSILPRPC